MKKRFVLPLVLAPVAVAAQHAARVRFVAPELRHQRLYQVTEVASRAVLKYRRATTKDRPWDPRVEVLSVPQGYVYTPPGAREDAIMLWVHGGGTIMGSPEHDHDVVSGYALELGVEILSARYRLAPEHPFPAGHDDLWQALGWLRLKYPGRKIIIAGSSGGAGMAAGLVQTNDMAIMEAFEHVAQQYTEAKTELDQAERPVDVINLNDKLAGIGEQLGFLERRITP